MAFPTGSMIGADLQNPSSTALFTLNTPVMGSDNYRGQYVIATGTLTTGTVVYIASGGTANALTTAQVASDATGLDLGFVQFTMTQGQYGFVAKSGTNLYVLCTGTVPGGAALGFAAAAGTLQTAGAVAVGNSAAGIFVTTSASTATASVATAIVTFPRAVASAAALS